MTKNIIAKNMIAICGHIGTQKFNWQPESERFAIGYRNNFLIYNLAFSSFYINRAMGFIEKIVNNFGKLYIYGLFAKKDENILYKLSKIHQILTTTNWRGGFVTNIRNFRKTFINGKYRFSAVISVNYDYHNYSLPRESFLIGLPSVSVVDSNVKAENFTYPIPINSNTFATTQYMSYIISIAIFKGITKRILSRTSLRNRLKKLFGRKKRKQNKKIIKRIKYIYFNKFKKVLFFKKGFKVKEEKIDSANKRFFCITSIQKKFKKRLKKWQTLYTWYKKISYVKSSIKSLSHYDKQIALYAIGWPIARPIYVDRYPNKKGSQLTRKWNFRRNRGISKFKKIPKLKSVINNFDFKKYKLQIKSEKKKKSKKRKKFKKKKLTKEALLSAVNRKYKYFLRKRTIRLKLKKITKKFFKIREFYFKFKKIPKLRNFFEFKIKFIRPSILNSLLKKGTIKYKYFTIYNYLNKRKQKVIIIKKARERQENIRQRKVIDKIKKKEYRVYYHNFIIVKKPRKKKNFLGLTVPK